VRNEHTADYDGPSYDFGIYLVDQTLCLGMGARFVEVTATVAQPNPADPPASGGFL